MRGLYRKQLADVQEAIETFRGRIRACVMKTDVNGDPDYECNPEETFVCVDGLWYPESSIKVGARGYRREQLSELCL